MKKRPEPESMVSAGSIDTPKKISDLSLGATSSVPRILWIDYFKTLCISLVVAGHVGGVLSGYIYEFHMAAFFFISGYLTNYQKEDHYLAFLWKKIHSLILPLITINLLAAGCCCILQFSHVADRLIEFFALRFIRCGDFPIAEEMADTFLSLPIGPHMPEDNVKTVIVLLKDIIKH